MIRAFSFLLSSSEGTEGAEVQSLDTIPKFRDHSGTETNSRL
jgi:hypothetical protein